MAARSQDHASPRDPVETSRRERTGCNWDGFSSPLLRATVHGRAEGQTLVVSATPEQLRDGAGSLRDFVEQYRLEASRHTGDESRLRDSLQTSLAEMLRPCASADLT